MTDTELPLQKYRPTEQENGATVPSAGKRDVTTGNIHRNIWILAVPMTLEMAMLSVTQIADTYRVGKLGSAALAAVTISINLRWVINSLANGLGIGGMAVLARRIGAGDRAQADHATWQAVLLAVFVSLVLGAVGILLDEPALRILGADAEVLPMGGLVSTHRLWRPIYPRPGLCHQLSAARRGRSRAGFNGAGPEPGPDLRPGAAPRVWMGTVEFATSVKLRYTGTEPG